MLNIYVLILLTLITLTNQLHLNKNILKSLYGYTNESREIRLYSQNTTTIDPETFSWLSSNLELIILSDNNLTQIESNTFSSLNNLKTLSLSHNQLTSIDRISLQNISHNGFQIEFELDFNTLFNYNDLELLDLSLDLFILNGLSRLEFLWLDYNQLTMLQRFSFDGLYNLKELYLNNNKISEIQPFTFKDLINLKHLWLHDNQLKQIQPNTFSNLNNLFELSLLNNKLNVINTSVTFEALNNLKILSLSNNSFNRIIDYTETDLDFKRFDKSIKVILKLKRSNVLVYLNKLEQLFLNDNQLVTIYSNTLNGLFSLQKLDLSSNHLSIIERLAFNDLKHLVELFLFNNKIKLIQSYLFSGLTSLKMLYLNENYIEEINKDAFKSLNSLVELDLSDNLLETIDQFTFEGLQRLECLFLNTNEDVQISAKTFKYLTNLTQLELSSNGIETFKNGTFDSLSKLEYLLLSKNDLTNFNGVLNSSLMINLKEVNLEYNRINILDPSLFNGFYKLERVCFYSNFIDFIKYNRSSEIYNKNYSSEDLYDYEENYDVPEQIKLFCGIKKDVANNTCLLIYKELC